MSIAYSVCEDIVFHGGTAIWRCFSGKRFSEDLDFYSRTFPDASEEFVKMVKSHGLTISKLKDTGNVICPSISNSRATVKIEVNHVIDVKGVETAYELVDGSSIEIICLSPENLVIEKIAAYRDRKFIRDLYDIYHLTGYGVEIEAVKKELIEFLSHTDKPVDEGVLKSIVYLSLPPSYEKMISTIRRRVS
ncbi:hypothetical protein IX51_09515 [uncultured archaeon]|nr:hypothetical protein IX51_09515 [uncultured archaeon]